MTFAGGFVRNCDCDECDLVPKPIADAIRQHKRMIAKTSTLTRTQDRTLVARLGLISVWKLTMPLDAEPLVEFGNSHRIVLIDALSSVCPFVVTTGYSCNVCQLMNHPPCITITRNLELCPLEKVLWDLLTKQLVEQSCWIGAKAQPG